MTPNGLSSERAEKKLNSVQDIFTIFLKMSPQAVPCYVAKELSRLPSLTMNCFDVKDESQVHPLTTHALFYDCEFA